MNKALQAKMTHKAAASYKSDDQLLDALLGSTDQIETIALCEVLKERGHGDLVNEFHKDDLTRKLALVDTIMARL